ncbi:hypothetical protein AURDEDRAFT_147829 [Auricularia subglabra TFB-10046 SS5]|nr:hypothetical protein AURDEDRAFT_147829 [Auricularia subglabra TFB-10046 SS5]
MLNPSAFLKGADSQSQGGGDDKPPAASHPMEGGQQHASSSRDNLAAKPASASSRSASEQPKRSHSGSSLLPPYTAGQRPHLPTPQSSAHSPPRHLNVGSPGSPSIPLSSRAHGSQQDSHRRALLPSPSTSQISQPGRTFAQRMSHFTPSPSPATLPSSSPVIHGRTTHSASDVFDVATPTSSPARSQLRDANLQTPSSPDRQESLPRTPAHPHGAWDVAHISSSPLDGPSHREPRIERPRVGDRDPFVAQEQKSLQASTQVTLRTHFDEPHGLSSRPQSPDRVPSSSRAHGIDPSPDSRQYPNAPAAEQAPRLVPPSLEAGPADSPQTPRMQHATGAYRPGAHNAYAHEKEQKRPEYLKRTKRPRDLSDAAAAERHEREMSQPGVGVHVSPKKGRRLKLYQPPTPKQVDDRPASSKLPSTPRSQPGPVISNKARAWLEASSPSAVRTRTKSLSSEEKAEKENKKRKRLEAFTRKAVPPGSPPLEVYDVQGRGRMLVSKAAARVALIVTNPDVPQPSGPVDPDWPDTEYPWVGATKQPLRPPCLADMSEEEARARLHWIERFLDRESDEEGSSDESAKLQGSPSRASKTQASASDTRARRAALAEPLADARTALFSRREIQRLTDAQQETEDDNQSHAGTEAPDGGEEEEEDDGIVSCICGEDEDERPMVACDRCSIWFHQICMGIKNPNDLEDTWYCFDCRKARTPTPPPPPPQPVFSVSSPDTHVRPSLDKPLFQTAGLTASPAFDTRLYAGLGSPSPTRSHDSRPSSWLDTPDLLRHAPSTPGFGSFSSRDSRILRTPGGFDPFDDGFPPFDPTSTPSRGLGFSGLSFGTPTQRRSSGGLSGRTPVTPKPAGGGGGRSGPSFFAAMDDPFVGSSPLDRLARIVGEESPLATTTRPKLPPRPTTPTPEPSSSRSVFSSQQDSI